MAAPVLDTEVPHFASPARLLKSVGIDCVAGFAASFLVSPFINIIDRAIIENASGARALGESMKQLTREFLSRPWQFIRRRDFLLIHGLYTSTYIAANSIDTVCELAEKSSTAPKLIGVSAINIVLCVLKDREYTRMFGVIAPAAVPAASLALYGARDMMTMFASFTVPQWAEARARGSHGAEAGAKAHTTAQMVAPAAIQLLSTPLHLLGLDLYNNPGRAGRGGRIQANYIKSAMSRVSRTVPAFGIGGVGNKLFRDTMRARWLS